MKHSGESPYYRIKIGIPRQIRMGARTRTREALFEWLWKQFGTKGLLGIHEGTLLSEDAAREGFETESWTVDAAEAPRERDWVEDQSQVHAELYFETRKQAGAACKQLKKVDGLVVGSVDEQEQQDWDAQWKAAFLASPEGVRVPPYWRIVPPWPEFEDGKFKAKPGERLIKINPGAGFGTGTHETTQLCLQALAAHWPRAVAPRAATTNPESVSLLDFGSGSGILAIAGALLGGRAEGVEIDPLAVENAHENAKINGVETRVQFSLHLGAVRPYDVVFANILKPVLLQFGEELVSRLRPGGGILILSGLIAGDADPVAAYYGRLLGGARPGVLSLNEWRALVFVRPSQLSPYPVDKAGQKI